jgi:hypothetical protein
MSKKSIFLIILCFLGLLQTTFAVGKYKKGDILTVFYTGGLNLRAQADINSDVITRLEFSNSVKVVDDHIGQTAFEDDFMNNYMLKGFWVLVEINDKRGYVFDGYLSTVRMEAGEYYGNAKQNVEKMLGSTKSSVKGKEHKKGLGKYTIATYENGWIWEEGTYNGCTYSKATFSNLTFEESLLMMNFLYSGFSPSQRDLENPKQLNFSCCYCGPSDGTVSMIYDKNVTTISNHSCPEWK